MAAGALEGILAGELGEELVPGGTVGRWRGWRGGAEELTAKGEVGGAGAVGEEAVVADADEAVGEDVEQEAADELVGGEGHRAAGVAGTVVLVRERDHAVVEGEEAVV